MVLQYAYSLDRIGGILLSNKIFVVITQVVFKTLTPNVYI